MAKYKKGNFEGIITLFLSLLKMVEVIYIRMLISCEMA